MKNKNILLVNPPSGFLIDQRVFLPLGIASVAASARESGHDVHLLDLADENNYERVIIEEISGKNYDAVGITATSPQFYYAYRLLGAIRRSRPDMKVIIGGSHASMFSALRDNLKESRQNYQELMDEDPNFKKLEEFDVIAAGEEASLEAALSTEGKGIWVDGGITTDLEKLPFPARDLFDINSYLYDSKGLAKFKINGKAAGSIISQRGCPYTCEFCCGRDSKMYHSVRLPGGILRTHSPERIVAELDDMNKRLGLESFMFYDDEFNLHPDRTIKLCDELKKRNYTFRGFAKSDLLVRHPEVATAMKNAGFVEVLTGIESGSERILERHLHKRTSPELNYRAAMICLENGLDFKALTMIGHVSETPRDVMDTRDWILKAGKLYQDKAGSGHFTFDLTVFQPYAGCPIWDRAQKNKGLFEEDFKWAYHSMKDGKIVDPEYGGLYFNKVDFSTEQGFYKGIPGKYKAFIRTKTISPEQLVSLRDAIEWDVRDRLKMNQLTNSSADTQFEHSMGQGAIRKK